MNPRYGESGAIKPYSDCAPQAWLTNPQQDHSESFTGSERERKMASAIRDRERLGSDGMVRTLPALSLSYGTAMEMLGWSE